MTALTAPAALSISHLRVILGGSVIIPNLSHAWSAGSRTILLGPNGAGKTTLLNAISGHIAIKSGDISANGTAISRWPPHARARRFLQRSFQVPQLPSELSIRETLTLAARRDNASALTEMLGEFQLDTLADRAVATLGHATRKLVEVATALIGDAPIVLLDEPAAGLGANEKALLAPALRRRTHNTLIIVEHDLAFIEEIAMPMLFMSDGAIACEGDLEMVRQFAVSQNVYF